jgi:hypothetical protein
MVYSGIWESLHATTDKSSSNNSDNLEKFLQDKGQGISGQFDDVHDEKADADEDRRNDNQRDDNDHGRGTGVEKDLKGKDWNCSSCLNLNWSWRTNCNMCGTIKPSVSTVSFHQERPVQA